MGLIFDQPPTGLSNAGSVCMLRGTDKPGNSFKITGWHDFVEKVGTHVGFSALLTGISMRETANYQIQHTFGNRAYLNVFGMRVGVMELSGLALYENCDAFYPIGFARIGIADVIQYFRTFNLSNTEPPLRITIDPFTVYLAFLHSFQGGMVGDSQTMFRMYQFHLTLLLIPPEIGKPAWWS